LTGSTSVPENKPEICHVIHLQPTLKIIWKEFASFARQVLRADKQSFAREAARMPGRITNIRITYLSNSVDGEEGSFLYKRKEADVSAADISKIKLRWPSTTLTRQLSPFRLTLEAAPINPGKYSSKKPRSVSFSA
jgi:hypothetical protein